jgi:excisionase family DNA binding protein
MQTTHAQDSCADLTVSEAARLAKVSADTIRRYADAGTLPSYRLPSQHRRFKHADVARIFAGALAEGGDAA